MREVWDGLSFDLPPPPLGSNAILGTGQWCTGVRDQSMRLVQGPGEIQRLWEEITGLGEHACTRSVPASAFTMG